MNKHPHEEVILAYYRGEQIQLCNLDGQWEDITKYGTGIVFQSPPKFTPDRLYRIKPQPPKLHTVELTQQEIEAVWVLLRRVGGCEISSARAQTSSVLHKLAQFIDVGRGNALHLWAARDVSGGMCFSKRLPE